jgi:hypothetical protein
MDRHRLSLPQTTEGKSGRWRSGATAVLYGPAAGSRHQALTLQRLAVTVKLTNTHMAADVHPHGAVA